MYVTHPRILIDMLVLNACFQYFNNTHVFPCLGGATNGPLHVYDFQKLQGRKNKSKSNTCTVCLPTLY